VLNGVACNLSGRSYLAAFKTPHPPKAQISKFKIKETEHTHHFLLVDLAVIGCFITIGVLSADAKSLNEAYKNQQSNIQVKGSGKVVRILNDDNQGSRHQKFIPKLSSVNTVLIAHNIDLALRINSISNGDTVEFYGVYEWNKKGGVVHWAHRAPNNYHINGWLKHRGSVYQ
jgi:hypothetical protein